MSMYDKLKLKYLDLKAWFEALSDMEKVQCMSIAVITLSYTLGQVNNALHNRKRLGLSAMENQTVRSYRSQQ